jgi:hypothetical protein
MHACNGTNTRIYLGIGEYMVNSLNSLAKAKSIVLILGLKTNVAFFGLWTWVKGVHIVGLQINILKLLIYLLDSKFSLTCESHIYLDWKSQSSLT